MSKPKTVSELYPSQWLRAADLRGRAVIVIVTRCTLEEVNGIGGTADRAILDFGRTKRLILNKTQCQSMANITGSEAFADWPGHRIQLTPAQARNGKPTIHISAAPQPMPAADEDEEE